MREAVAVLAGADEVAQLRERVRRLEQFAAIIWPIIQAVAPAEASLLSRVGPPSDICACGRSEWRSEMGRQFCNWCDRERPLWAGAE